MGCPCRRFCSSPIVLSFPPRFLPRLILSSPLPPIPPSFYVQPLACCFSAQPLRPGDSPWRLLRRMLGQPGRLNGCRPSPSSLLSILTRLSRSLSLSLSVSIPFRGCRDRIL